LSLCEYSGKVQDLERVDYGSGRAQWGQGAEPLEEVRGKATPKTGKGLGQSPRSCQF